MAKRTSRERGLRPAEVRARRHIFPIMFGRPGVHEMRAARDTGLDAKAEQVS